MKNEEPETISLLSNKYKSLKTFIKILKIFMTLNVILVIIGSVYLVVELDVPNGFPLLFSSIIILINIYVTKQMVKMIKFLFDLDKK